MVVAHTPGLDVRRHGQIVSDRYRSRLRRTTDCVLPIETDAVVQVQGEDHNGAGLRARGMTKELHQAQPTLVNHLPLLTLYRSDCPFARRMCWPPTSAESPGVLEEAQVVVNTWPTSRWLGEQLALANPSGITANLLSLPDKPAATHGGWASGAANLRRWSRPLAGTKPGLASLGAVTGAFGPSIQCPVAALVEHRKSAALEVLDPPLWQLARAIADAIDDYSLYRPAMLEAWLKGQATDAAAERLSPTMLWQPQLMQQLHSRLGCLPFGMRARQLIRRLQEGWRRNFPPTTSALGPQQPGTGAGGTASGPLLFAQHRAVPADPLPRPLAEAEQH